MHPKLLILQLLAMSFLFRFASPVPCSRTFKCGNKDNIEYPFWGGPQPSSCGHPDFQLNCHPGSPFPILNISSVSYQVMDINKSTQTLLLARQDLSDIRSSCPTTLYNTTFKSRMFQFPSQSTDKNITLFFSCTLTHNYTNLPNQFSCYINGVQTLNFFNKEYASGAPGPGITCNSNIYVPINSGAFYRLMDVNDLYHALIEGFWVNYTKLDVINRYNRGCGEANQCLHDEDETNVEEVHLGGDGNPQAPTGSQGSESYSGQSKSIIIGLVVGITSIVILMIIVLYYIKRPVARSVVACWSRHQGQDKEVEKLVLYYGSLALRRYKYHEIKKMTKSFSDKLGQGGYGSVYKGMLPDGRPVAVKVLIETKSNGEEFINEVASISRTSHINIVGLLGFCYERNKRALVYEFMPNKSLDRFICNAGSRNVDCHLDWGTLYKIAIGVAKGLEYLHTGCNTKIVHFDIKPQNILLDGDFCPKISDFGLAKLCKTKQSIFSLVGARGTIGYIAPEIFSTNFGRVSYKSDVYSYGMMVLEMARGRKNMETEVVPSTHDSYFPDEIYESFLLDFSKKLDHEMVEDDDKSKRRMFFTGFWCIQTAPSDRPSMSKVVEMLEGNLESIQIPPKPVLFSPTLSGSGHDLLELFSDTEFSTECLLKDDVHRSKEGKSL